jgi:hypothetical protein
MELKSGLPTLVTMVAGLIMRETPFLWGNWFRQQTESVTMWRTMSFESRLNAKPCL